LRPSSIFADLSPTEEAPVFEEFMGVPFHPLLVHAAVVFVPLLALLAVAYALLPFVRAHVRWVLGVLAVVAPLATLISKISGDAFFRRRQARGTGPDSELYAQIQSHQHLGTIALYWTITLGVLTLIVVYLIRPTLAAVSAHATGVTRSRAVQIAITVLLVVDAAITLYYVVRTGDSGAKTAWTGS
jgi:hypothetical protein